MKMGHQVIPEEIKAIVRRLDIDGDQRISFSEFIESISPVSPDLTPSQALLRSAEPSQRDHEQPRIQKVQNETETLEENGPHPKMRIEQ